MRAAESSQRASHRTRASSPEPGVNSRLSDCPPGEDNTCPSKSRPPRSSPVIAERLECCRRCLHAIPAALLGSIERFIRSLQNLLQGQVWSPIASGHPDAYRNGHGRVGGHGRSLANQAPDFIRSFRGCNEIAVGQNNQKLLASITPDQIVGSQLRLQAFRDFFQYCVTRSVPVRIIEALEVVYIDHKNGHRLAITFTPREFAF